MGKIDTKIVCFYSFLVATSLACAADVTTDEMLKALESDMLNISETAAMDKQNIDYKPYIVSVLRQEQLQKLGMITLRDALKLVPGVDLSVGMMGVKYPVFRGSNPYSMGQSQLYIDGNAVNDAIFNAYYHYLDMPIDIIDRIEVVRGPGSLLAHENAYGGSINVITKSADKVNETLQTRVFGGASNQTNRQAGVQTLVKNGSWLIGGDGYWQNSWNHYYDGPDSQGDSREAYFDNENYGIGFNARNENWEVGGRLTSQMTGPNYGQMFTLSEDPSDYLNIRTNNFHLTYTDRIADETVLKVSGEYLDQRRRLKNKTIADGNMGMMPGMGMVMFPEGRYFYVDYDERKLSSYAQLENKSLENWTLLGGLKQTQYTVQKNEARMERPNGTFMYSDLLMTDRRDITTFYGEATYTPQETTSVAMGFKYDDISDHGKMFSPRLSAVHLLDSNNILKAMFTRSYTLPSWRNEYFFNAPSNYGYVGVEKVDSYELSYIYKMANNGSIRLNTFYLKNKDQIVIDPLNISASDKYDTTIKGAEFEIQYAFDESDEVSLNYSYADGKIDRDGSVIPNSAKHMASLNNIYYITDKLTTGTVLKYVGEKSRDVSDPRVKLDDYLTWDQSLNYNDYEKGYSISLSVENIADTKYYFPAVAGTYPNDFVQPGRTVWLRFEKSWK